MVNAIQKSTDCGMYASYEKLPKLVPIAPALDGSMDLQSEKLRYSYKSNPYTGAQAASIARRNARERNRVKQVNDGFNMLRKRLPASIVSALSGGSRRGSGKKLSKVDTLRMVVEYIRYLQNVLEESDAAAGIVRNERLETSVQDGDEPVFDGRLSPYSESVSSPATSETSSGVSSAASYPAQTEYYGNYHHPEEQFNNFGDSEMLDASMWWNMK